MLTDQAIERIAESHVRTEEGRLTRPDASFRLQVVKLCEVDDPSGVYYGTKVLEPTDGLLLGGGGFFVGRTDGAVQEFGSGELYAACQASPDSRLGDLQVTPAVVRFLLSHRAASIPAPSRKKWWQLWS